MVDLAVRQGLLQFGHASVGDLRVVELKYSQLEQFFKMHKTSVGDLIVIEIKYFYLRKWFQGVQASIRDLGLSDSKVH